MISNFSITTEDMVDIGDVILDTVKKSGIKDGVCVVAVQNEMASILTTSKSKKSLHKDIVRELEHMVPPRLNFISVENPVHVAAAVKAAIVKNSLDLIIHDGVLMLPDNQSIFLTDYIGERTLNYVVTCH